MAIDLGYKNVYRDPLGYPEWQAKGLPVQASPSVLVELASTLEKPKSFQGWAIIWTLLGIFAGGIVLNLTPCVYPLIPITVSYFGGKTGQRRGKLLFQGPCYIGGLSVTNSLLGLTAALTVGLMGLCCKARMFWVRLRIFW